MNKIKLSKLILVSVLMLLLGSYLGVNLLDFELMTLSLLRLSALGLLLFLIFSNNINSFKLKLSYVFALGLILIGSLTSSIALNLLFIFLFVYAVRKAGKKQIISTATVVLGFGVFLSLLLLYFNVTKNIMDVAESASDIGMLRERMTFGFKNVNAFSSMLVIFLVLCMVGERFVIMRYILASLLACVFYYYTDSRTLMFTVICILFFLITFKIFHFRKQVLFFITLPFIIFPVLLTLFAPLVIDTSPIVDLILSGRLSYVRQYLVEWSSWNYIFGGAEPLPVTTVDNSFALLLGAIGLPIFSLFLYKFLHLIKMYIECSELKEYSLMMGVWVLSFSESVLVRPDTIVPLVFWSLFVIGDKRLVLRRVVL